MYKNLRVGFRSNVGIGCNYLRYDVGMGEWEEVWVIWCLLSRCDVHVDVKCVG